VGGRTMRRGPSAVVTGTTSGAFTWSTVLSLDYALTELVPQLQETVAAG
jgi:hypothetical protein